MCLNYPLVMFKFWKLNAPIQTYESTISIIKVYNFTKLIKTKSKYTIQFFKVKSPLHNLFLQVGQCGLLYHN